MIDDGGETRSALIKSGKSSVAIDPGARRQWPDMWWIVHIEGGPRRVNHAAVAVGEFSGQEDLDLLGLLNLNDSGRFCLR